MTWQRALALLALTVALAAGIPGAAGAYEGSSLYDNVAPESQLHGSTLVDKYPLNRYGLDYHVTAGVDSTNVLFVKVPTDVDFTDLPALAAHALAGWMWDGIRLMLSVAITAFTFAFSLDLITGATGALAPLARATQNLYRDMGPWLPIGIMCLGLWGMVRLLRRQYTATFSQIGLTMLYMTLAMWIITSPMTTIGGVSKWSNEFSVAILGELDGRTQSTTQDPKTAAADRLFRDLIYEPWVALEFGGLEHCVDANNQPIKPRSADCDPSRKVDHVRKYADRWLHAGIANGKQRSLEYKALADGRIPSKEEIDNAKMPADAFDGYHVSDADKPAVDIQQAPGVGERLVAVTGVGFASLAATVLLASLSFGMILMQVFALMLFAGAPFVLLLAMFPGPGHRLFEGWVSKLGFAITRKILYALVLATLLTITHAVRDATVDLGWGFSYGLISLFYVLIVAYRHEIYDYVERSLPGGRHAAGHHQGLGQRATSAYYTAKMARPIASATRTAALAPVAAGGAAVGEVVGRGARLTRLAGRGAASVADNRAANGHTGQMAAAAGTYAEALQQLESEHRARVKRLRREESRRAQARALRKRAKVTEKPEDPDAPQPLSEKERATLASLESNLMAHDAFEGLRDSVREVERRRRESEGVAFMEAHVREREAKIRAERAAQNGTANGYGETGTDFLQDLVHGPADTRRAGGDDAPYRRNDGDPPEEGSVDLGLTQTQVDAQRLQQTSDSGFFSDDQQQRRQQDDAATQHRAWLKRIRPRANPRGGASGARDNQPSRGSSNDAGSGSGGDA